MAAIQERNGSFRVIFRHHGKQHTFTLGRVSPAEAQAKADQVDYLLMRLGQGLLSLQPGGDIVAFVRHDGTPPQPADLDVDQPTRSEPTLADLRDRYLEAHDNGTLSQAIRGTVPEGAFGDLTLFSSGHMVHYDVNSMHHEG